MVRTPVTTAAYTDLYELQDVTSDTIEDVSGDPIYFIGPSIPFNPQRT